MKRQLHIMLELQESMNRKVHPDWRLQGYEWYRAIWIECAELMEHYGWKWWKKQQPDRDQVALELIDIWHFGLSQLLESSRDREELVNRVAAALTEVATRNRTPSDFLLAVEAFAGSVLHAQAFDAARFAQLMVDAELGFDELYQRYVGKNVLNMFRQDHGYQSGEYRKQWGDREDNEHLVEILRSLETDSVRFKEDLYEALARRYAECR